jgi:hypothetical protein
LIAKFGSLIGSHFSTPAPFKKCKYPPLGINDSTPLLGKIRNTIFQPKKPKAMAKVTNYAVQNNKDGTGKVFLEITGEQELLLCNYKNRLVDVVPKCIVPSVLDEPKALKLIGKPATGLIKKVLVQPYEVVHLPKREIYCFSFSFGFMPYKLKQVIGITPVKSTDIQ